MGLTAKWVNLVKFCGGTFQKRAGSGGFNKLCSVTSSMTENADFLAMEYKPMWENS